MRVGLIARADNRGLGNQTWEFYRHMNPAKTLVVDMRHRTPHEHHFDRYPDAWAILRDEELNDKVWKKFCKELDVVYTAETPYEYSLYEVARDMGVRTVCHINPEFYRHGLDKSLPVPDVMAVPSTWRIEGMPGAIHLPFPVARDRLKVRYVEKVETFLHVMGHPALAERNGTDIFMTALNYVRVPMKALVTAQTRLPRRRGHCRFVDLVVREGDVENYWDLYQGADALVMPRKYGGQCLPINEAMSLGLPVLAPNRCPENEIVPGGGLVRCRPSSRMIRTQAGPVRLEQVDPRVLARAMEQLVQEPELVGILSKASNEKAEQMSWESLKPKYFEVLRGWYDNGDEV